MGGVTDRDCDDESFPRRNPARRTAKEMVHRSDGGKGPQNTTESQTAARCDKGGKVGSNTPMLPLFLAAGAAALEARFIVVHQKHPEAAS